jgi:hypothetical protein
LKKTKQKLVFYWSTLPGRSPQAEKSKSFFGSFSKELLPLALAFLWHSVAFNVN